MASSLHLDSSDLQKLAAAQLNLKVIQQNGEFVVSWPGTPFSASLRSLLISGAVKFENATVDVQSIELNAGGIDVKFSAADKL